MGYSLPTSTGERQISEPSTVIHPEVGFHHYRVAELFLMQGSTHLVFQGLRGGGRLIDPEKGNLSLKKTSGALSVCMYVYIYIYTYIYI